MATEHMIVVDRDNLWRWAERLQGRIAAEIRVMLGEAGYPESIFTDAERARRIQAMQECAVRSTSDEERHESWTKMHVEAGWVHGPVFDPIAKTHPNLMPWSELPPAVKSKARIFDIIAKAVFALET